MIVLIAIFVGLLINYIFGGVTFNSLLCAFAGLFLIMPNLLNVKMSDLKESLKNKKLISINLIINFIVLPLIFFVLAKIFFGNNPIIYAFLLLGLMSGGGLVFAWVVKTAGNMKTAFSLFLLNISIFSLIFLPLNYFYGKIGTYLFLNPQIQSQASGNIFSLEFIPFTVTNHSCFLNQILPGFMSCFGTNTGGASPLLAFLVLIIIPIIISRIILLFPTFTQIIKGKLSIIGKIASFFIIAYIFSLKEVHNLFSIDLIYLSKIFIVLALAYITTFSSSYLILKKLGKTPENISLFWNSTTRFITLGIVFSFSFSSDFGLGFMIVFVLAYFLQIGLSLFFSKIINKKEEVS
ncbi:MAG: hypothetical protein PHR68_02275 [Candidatus Gracilibacteria bacterium]|nr:hypothetical protein [Candidatus Gracilibacteria bacterium]